MVPQVGAAILVKDSPSGEKILMGKRGPKSKRGVGLWSVPGGAVDPGETIKGAAARELEEETGLYMPLQDAMVVGVTHAVYEEESWVTFYVTSASITGKPEVKEPGKCEGWEFIHFAYLRQMSLLPTFARLVQRRGWHHECLWHVKDLLREV